MPINSLPGKYGIGCFSEEAYHFVDFLQGAGQSCWQILPIHPTGYGDSPYQSFSTYAGNPYFIDLDKLIAEGVLMPIGALVMSVLIGWFWKTDIIKKECEDSGQRFWGYKYFSFCFKYIVPVVMAVIFYAQLVDFFK